MARAQCTYALALALCVLLLSAHACDGLRVYRTAEEASRLSAKKGSGLSAQSAAALVNDPLSNKVLAFADHERAELGLDGFLPAGMRSLEREVAVAKRHIDAAPTDLDRYVLLEELHDRSETAYYRLLVENVNQMLPIVYTPTVGQACINFSSLWRRPRGLYLSATSRGRFHSILSRWSERQPEVDVIVVTDGSRILGLGDLGANGMGIPIGKLSLYVAAAGIDPKRVLPVLLDVGTNNKKLLEDPDYIGLRQRRAADNDFYGLVEEFVSGVKAVWPRALLQWEDFTNDHAFPLLDKYRERILSFNDDIQGTGSVILAGFLGALRATKQDIASARIVFYGAGSAATGVADMMLSAIEAAGVPHEQALAQFWFVDSKGLVTLRRPGTLQPHKVKYARKDDAPMASLLEVVRAVRPTVLLGLSGDGGSFTEEVVRAMHRAIAPQRPVVFALSNPTSKAECTAEQAYTWTEGQAIFASGSPFKPVALNGKVLVPGQGNNMYIFPGVGLGASLAGIPAIPDELFALAARTLADMVPPALLEQATVYPDSANIRDISARIAAAIVDWAVQRGVSSLPAAPKDTLAFVKEKMWFPQY